jgi:hypothetical protein
MSRRVEGWFDPEEKDFTVAVMLGPKTFHCPGCNVLWKVAPVKHGRYWDYEGVCGNVACGATWVNRYHAYRRPTEAEKEKDRKETGQVNLPYADT